MPLRRVVSQSERFLDVSQYETLRRGLEAVYGPYSTSAPSTRHSTIEARQDTKRHGVRTSPLARVARATRVAILTALTRQKSQRTEPNFEAKEIGCYRVRGGGRGCDPATPHEGLAVLGPAPAFPPEINVMELSTNPAPALSAPAAGPPFYR